MIESPTIMMRGDPTDDGADRLVRAAAEAALRPAAGEAALCGEAGEAALLRPATPTAAWHPATATATTANAAA